MTHLSILDFPDPDDPIRRIVVPHIRELDEWGRLDPSDEKTFTVMPGLEHKYPSTVLFLVSNVCAAICRYCFRKRLFMRQNEEIARDLTPAFEYVARHREITDVLLTGGDPLVLSTNRLRTMMKRFAAMPHVGTIRLGTKIPAFNPQRITDDEDLLDAVWGYDTIPFTRTVDTHIGKLRKKIERDPANPQILLTVHRVGYKLVR